MKKTLMTLLAMTFAITASAQYNVGSSTRRTDSFGNTTSTHRNQYGQTTGTSSSHTDSFGNTNTEQRSNNSGTSIWTW